MQLRNTTEIKSNYNNMNGHSIMIIYANEENILIAHIITSIHNYCISLSLMEQ